MNDGFERILTVDGATGTGKTALLRALVARYDCMALELGPVVRAVSWLAETRSMTIADAVAELARADATARLRIDSPAAGNLAASEIELAGLPLRQQLFSGRLAAATAATSRDGEAMDWINGLVREKLRGSTAVVSAREAARCVCPTAGLRIRLEADARERAARKRRLLVDSGMPTIFVDDVSLVRPSDAVHVALDTTGLDAGEVAQRVFGLVDRHLHWTYKLGVRSTGCALSETVPPPWAGALPAGAKSWKHPASVAGTVTRLGR
jgi:cytidylate kinase